VDRLVKIKVIKVFILIRFQAEAGVVGLPGLDGLPGPKVQNNSEISYDFLSVKVIYVFLSISFAILISYTHFIL
jgi:hypothetical protein